MIYVSYLVGVAPKHCFYRIFRRWGRPPLIRFYILYLIKLVHMYLIVFVSKISAGGTRLLEVRRAPLVSWAVRTTRSKGFLHSRPKPVSSDFLNFGCGNLTKSKCIGAYKLRCLFFLFRNIYMYLVVEFLQEIH